jgi:PTH2 family peptidyl-tRNA hydrolase
MSDVKQWIVVRTDLKSTQGHKIRTGKLIAQACHASMSFLVPFAFQMDARLNDEVHDWLTGSFTKICLKVGSEQELVDIYEKAKTASLEVHLITDKGLTEFGGVPTKTCLALGPHYSSKVQDIIGHLEVL